MSETKFGNDQSVAARKKFIRDIFYYKAKSLLRPITSRRRLLEKIKYAGTTVLSAEAGNLFIAESVGRPMAIGKMGSNELGVLRYYVRHADAKGNCRFPDWLVKNNYRIAGVYPPDNSTFSKFAIAYANSLADLDILAVWFNWQEKKAYRRFAPRATPVALQALEPFYHQSPWSRMLAGKRVLVISPFAATIEQQYRKRRRLWPTNPEVLPDFDLSVLRSPLSAFLAPPEYPDWFAALDAMKEQMASLKFDAVIVGAGAWSLPLVAYGKQLGAWSIHMGGATQLLFGIKGGRWDNFTKVASLYNDDWTRPSTTETPGNVALVEGGCYW